MVHICILDVHKIFLIEKADLAQAIEANQEADAVEHLPHSTTAPPEWTSDSGARRYRNQLIAFLQTPGA
jgi:hypothetical protein